MSMLISTTGAKGNIFVFVADRASQKAVHRYLWNKLAVGRIAVVQLCELPSRTDMSGLDIALNLCRERDHYKKVILFGEVEGPIVEADQRWTLLQQTGVVVQYMKVPEGDSTPL